MDVISKPIIVIICYLIGEMYKIITNKELSVSAVKETKDRALKNLRKALEKYINVIDDVLF